MNTNKPNPVESIRLLAARSVLGLLQSWDVPPVADQALSDGLYSDSIAELAAVSYPTMDVVLPLLRRAMIEIGITEPTRAEAAWYLARHCVVQVAKGDEPVLESLSLLRNVVMAAEDVVPRNGYFGGGFDVAELMGIYYTYDEPNENYYEPEQRVITDENERHAILERLAREDACRWLTRHKSIEWPDRP